MRTTRVVHLDPTKRLQMEALLAEAHRFGLRLAEVNALKPWGGSLRFTKDSLVPFLAAYWLDVKIKPSMSESFVDPKILLVAPKQMLSLQWHERRGEIWRVIDGTVGVTIGDGWGSLSHKAYTTGKLIEIAPKKWHRLIGLEGWGRIAEFWDHTDTDPSNESDIKREHDIYGRDTNPQADENWKSVYPCEIETV